MSDKLSCRPPPCEFLLISPRSRTLGLASTATAVVPCSSTCTCRLRDCARFVYKVYLSVGAFNVPSCVERNTVCREQPMRAQGWQIVRQNHVSHWWFSAQQASRHAGRDVTPGLQAYSSKYCAGSDPLVRYLIGTVSLSG
jgi:hypothetical protein